MNDNPYNTPYSMAVIPEPQFPDIQIDSSAFPSIQAAVDHCSLMGGGTVVVPEGEWASAGIHLRSNIHLHLNKGAVISFSTRPEDYLPVVFTRWEGTECYNYSPFIYAENCHNIAVTGEGLLHGNGKSWWSWKTLQQEAADQLCYSEANSIPVKDRIYGTQEAALRPSFLQLINCTDILIQGITMIDGPQWTLHPVYCENVIIRSVHIHTTGPNTDGLNPDSCKNVLIEDSDFYTGDDCIAINAGINEDGWRVNRPCENIVIRRCTMTGGHGGLVIGSAVSGGVKNVYAHDCNISGTMQGIRLKSMRGRGGVVENILFENITVNNVTNEAIQINMFYEFSTVIPKNNTPSEFKNITLRNVTGTSDQTGIVLKGLPEMKLNNIFLENINLNARNSMVCSDVDGLEMKQVKIK